VGFYPVREPDASFTLSKLYIRRQACRHKWSWIDHGNIGLLELIVVGRSYAENLPRLFPPTADFHRRNRRPPRLRSASRHDQSQAHPSVLLVGLQLQTELFFESGAGRCTTRILNSRSASTDARRPAVSAIRIRSATTGAPMLPNCGKGECASYPQQMSLRECVAR
jgi:hypothetical protein